MTDTLKHLWVARVDFTHRADFRNDINGLRAWAVVAVIFYHFGILGFGGGFVGVDVFFVISGFLMTGIVVKGLERGTFSVFGFYLARARRIVPALVVLCAVLLALGWFVLLPPDYKMLSTHSAYALSFLSNVEFWQEAGYFDAASHEKWLLHTWSLSVEWQFYLILPLVLWAVWRFKPGRKGQTCAVGVGLLASLAASVWITSVQPSAAFYLLHTRAWEMLGGGIVFLVEGNATLSAKLRRYIESAGLLMIVLAVAIFSKDTAWPSWRAVLPVAAAMLVLLANRTSLWTASKLPQWLGDRSYSLYLWHWPVVVALGYVDLKNDPFAIGCALILTGLLAHLSFAWVEIRSRHFLEKQRMSSATSGLALTVVAVTIPAIGIWKQQGVAGRFAPAVEQAAAETNNKKPRQSECFTKGGTKSPSCMYGGSRLKAVLIGDSHADAVTTALAAAVPTADDGIMDWTYVSCLTALGVKNLSPLFKAEEKCGEFLDWAVKKLVSIPDDIPLVIVNRTSVYVFGHNELWEKDANKPAVFFSKPYPTASAEFQREFAQQVTDTACLLAKNHPVYMVRPIPEMGIDVPKAMSRTVNFGKPNEVSISIDEYHKRHALVWGAQDAAHVRCGVKVLNPLPYLCNGGRCYGSKDGARREDD
jgi:peptidoglycan/LPS O-acetylase OafA/YrhL